MSITYRSVKGSKLTSNEVDANFQYLENRIGGDGNTITTQTGFTLLGQDLTINADWAWRILGVSYTNTASVVVNIPFAASGNQRIDLIVANQSNSFERIAGIESVSNPTAPAIPSNKIVVSFITVTDGTVGAPSDPILGTQFVKKTDNSSYSFSDSGTNVELAIPANGASMLFLTNAALVSISGFSLANISGNPTAEVPYTGKPFFIVNNTGVSITLNHDETATVPFFFVAGTDIVIPPGGIMQLRYATDGISDVFKSWSEVKEVIEGYFNGTNFYTDSGFTNLITPESGKIYIDIAVTPSTQYRWSGSAYVQIGSSETFDQSTWMFSDFFGESLNQLPFVGAVLNGGAKDGGVFSNGSGGYIGSHLLFSGVSANGGYRYTDTTNPAFGGFPPKNGLTFYGIFKLISQSDARDRVIRIGFHNATTGTTTPTIGAFLEILGSTATFKTKVSGLETASSPVSLLSGASSSGVFYKILIEFISTTSVNCKVVDDSNNIILEVNHTTNIPSGGHRFGCGLVATITTAGSNHQIMSVDYMGVGRQKPNFLNNF